VALLAAHLAFIAAESCARRSGERFSFFFAFLTVAGCFARARPADFLLAFIAFAASAASSFRFSFASFFGPSWRRFSSRRIFFFRFFRFMIVLCSHAANDLFNDEISLMSRLLFGHFDVANFFLRRLRTWIGTYLWILFAC
jgi:hypothetical protein